MIHTYNFRVEMPCSGCAGNVQRLLKAKQDKGGIMNFQINLQEKRVSVTTDLPVEEIHAELKKSGKAVTLLSSTKQELFGQTEKDPNASVTTQPKSQPSSRAQQRRGSKFQ